MALTEFQRGVCRLLAENRIRSGESYVAGGAALNELLHAPRRSRDLDLFHDTEQALAASWAAPRPSRREPCPRPPQAKAAHQEAEVASTRRAVAISM